MGLTVRVRPTTRGVALGLLGALAAASGCKQPAAPPGPTAPAADARAAGNTANADAGAREASAAPRPAPTGPTGTIEGTVYLEGPVRPNPPLPLEAQFANLPGCRDAARRYAQPFDAPQPGPFPGALVSALAHSEQSPEHHDRVFTFRDCEINPRVIFANEGDRILFHSDASRPHMPVVGGAQGSIIQLLIPRQADQERNIPGPGRYPITVRNLPSWVGSLLFVLPNRFIDTTDAQGHFRITDVPAGSVEVHAWYPGTHDATAQVNVPPGGTANVILRIQPVPSRPAGAPADAGPPVDAGYPFPT